MSNVQTTSLERPPLFESAKRRRRCFVRASVFIVFLVNAFVCPAWSKDVVPLELGSAAPDFKLPGVDDKEYSLADFEDAKLLLVVFTCNHCPTAQAYEQRIMDLHRDYAPKGVALVAISPNSAEAVRLDELGYTDLGDSLEDMKLRAEQLGFPFPYLYDGETQATSSKFGVLATPHVFLFDEARKLRYQGRIDDHEIKKPKSHDLRNAIDELLAGKAVSVPTTRVFGCSTKWKDKKASAEKALAKWNEETAELRATTPEKLETMLRRPSEKWRLVNVWATWCTPCVEEMDGLVEIHRMYRKRKFELVTVSADDLARKEDAAKILNAKHCSAKNWILDSSDRDALFDAVDPKWRGALPYTLLIAPDGKVVHRIHGEFEALELKREIVKHLGRTYAEKFD